MTDKRGTLLELMRQAAAAGRYAVDGIAIIGLAGRYPLAETPDALWTVLSAGRSAIREVPRERWDAAEHFDENGRDGKSYSKWAGFLDDVDKFDPLFFQISPVEAENMDPQERLFLETAWATLEDAGYTRRRLALNNPVGVFVGAMNGDYQWMAGEATGRGARTEAGSGPWSIANRVSHLFDLHGPSLAVDTACSASLTAIHLACQSLRQQECQVAIAGGVNLILHPMHLRLLAARGMISRGNRCRSFGNGADGFVDGEGVGAVLLKPLLQAILDRDRVYGVIRGSAINSGGRSSGYTVPRASAQAEVIRSAMRQARIDPRTISYIEAHGTGTPLGDPIEIAGLVEAFRAGLDAEIADVEGPAAGRSALGSVKSNIGHLESAAGIAGLTKVLLQLRHACIAPSLNANELNPEIDLSDSPFAVPVAPIPWSRPRVKRGDGDVVEAPRRAGISSFGGGGANAHLIVEEHITKSPVEEASVRPAPDRPQIIVLSARTEERLRVYSGRLSEFLNASGVSPQSVDPGTAAAQRQVTMEDTRSLAAELAGVDGPAIDDATDLAEYGFGIAEFSRMAERLSQSLNKSIAVEVLTSAGSVKAIAASLTTSAVGNQPCPSLADVAFTLQTGREAMEFRLALVARDLRITGDRLRRLAGGETPPEVVWGRAGPAQRGAAADRVAAAMQRADLPALAHLWVNGAEIVWERLHADAAPRRVGLPTYPFERKRYWIPEPDREPEHLDALGGVRRLPCLDAPSPIREFDQFGARGPAREPANPGLPTPTPGLACYRPVWVPTSLAPVGHAPELAHSRARERVVILASRQANWLADDILRHHCADEVHVLYLDDPAAGSRLASVGPIDRAYHLGAVRLTSAGDRDTAEMTDTLEVGVLALFDLARQLGEHENADRSVRLKVVSNDAFAVLTGDVENPLAAGVHTLARVIARERPRTSVECFDFAADQAFGQGRARLLEMLTKANRDEAGATLALRHGHAYLCNLAPVVLSEPAAPAFVERGVYVIVGGTGGIGRLLSVRLAEQHRARLVWISRGELREPQLACIEAVRAVGGEVLHFRADCTSVGDMRRAEAAARAQFGKIDGVIHAAMTFDDRRLAALSKAAFRAALAVKVDGSILLDAAFGHHPLDFMLFFSSVGAFGEVAGNGAYATAAAMQDAYGHFLGARRHYPVRVINWGYWGKVGSGARAGLAQIFEALGIGTLAPGEALDAVPRILRNRLPQVLALRAEPRALTTLRADPALAATVVADRIGPTLAEAAERLVRLPVDGLRIEAVIAAHRRLGTEAQVALLGAFRRMGAFRKAGEAVRKDALRSRLGIAQKYLRLYSAALNILATAGYLADEGDSVRSTPLVDSIGPTADAGGWEAAFDEIAAGLPDIAATVALTKCVLRSYPEIMSGAISGTEIIFPGASTALVEGLYRGNALADHFNRLVAWVVREYVGRRLPQLAQGEQIRLIELGAGTGATTKQVLDALPDTGGKLAYVYTDVSPIFLERGAEQFRDRCDFIDFHLCDLDRDMAAQGFPLASYDVVIASNVVHATQALRASLQHAKSLLVPHGWLVLNELTDPQPLSTLTGGPLEGWWRFTDPALRVPDSPLCRATTWQRLLREAGLGEPVILGTGVTGKDYGQHVLVAESDGIVATPMIGGGEDASGAVAVTDEPALQPTGQGTPIPIAVQDHDGERLHAVVAGALKLDERIDLDRPLADYGLDSLTGMRVADAVLATFGIKLPLATFYQHATLRELARHLRDLLPLAVARPPAPKSRIATAPASLLPAAHPLSAGQRALWAIEQTLPGHCAYNVPLVMRLGSGVDVRALCAALQSLLDSHDELRAVVHADDAEPELRIPHQQELCFQQRDLSVADETLALETIRTEVRRPFDLRHGPLFRSTLFTLAERGHVLLLCFHHIVTDGLSAALLLEQLEQAYRGAAGGQQPQRVLPAARYDDFVAWQRAMLADAEGERQRSYWLARLSGGLLPQQLPYDRPRPARPGLNGASLEGCLDSAVTQAARALASDERCSLSSVVLAAYLGLLYRYSLNERVTVGMATAGRPAQQFADVVGYFANMVVLTTEVRPEDGFRPLLRRVHQTVLEALENGDYPFAELVAALSKVGPAPSPELFRAAFYFQGWLRPGQSGTLIQGAFPGVHQEGEFDLTLDVVDQGETCAFTIKYNPDLFYEATVACFRDYLVQLLRAGLHAPDLSLNRLQLRDPEGSPQPRKAAPDAVSSAPEERLVLELIAEQAALRPDKIAASCDGVALSYRQLTARVDRLATCLARSGVAPGRTVGVLVERSLNMLVALLAVMKAGGAYVPLDPIYPPARVARIVQDAKPCLVITTASGVVALGDVSVPRLNLDLDQQAIQRAPGEEGDTVTTVPATADDAAYVIYTSGSTGEPNGVEVTHRSLANLLLSMQREPGFGPDDRMFALTTVCFDIAALELFLPLVAGGSVDIAPGAALKHARHLRQALESSGATVVQATPSTWKLLLAAGWGGDPRMSVLCGGEAIDLETADALLSRSKAAWNLYGPTETTIWSTVARLIPGEKPTIGGAVANTTLVLLDTFQQPVPPGIPGELFIGGTGVARGYFGRPALTAERFMPHALGGGASSRLFRTGDLMRTLADGRLEFLGRLDHQVKIRGHRVELREIETALQHMPGVREAVVVRAQVASPDGHALRAFYVGDGAANVQLLRRSLPQYMIPDVLVQLGALPRLPNGKIDRQALATAAPDALARAAPGVTPAPTSAAAPEGVAAGYRIAARHLAHDVARLVAVTAGLPLDQVAPAARFGELGLNSIGLTELSRRLNIALDIDVSPTAFYAHPTVAALTIHLAATYPGRFSNESGIERAAPRDQPVTTAPRTVSGTAIIGMAGRLPQSPDIDTFWRHLTAGFDLVEEIPSERWDWRNYAGDWRRGEHARSRWGGFVPDVDRFDAAFFGISPREAALMDPQQRLLLEVVWAAIEDAGYPPSALAGQRVGVFVGITNSDYLEVQRAAGHATEPHTVTGVALSIIPNRVSYLLDLHGPSLAVDTACSSSLTAIHQAIGALRDGCCDVAIAAAVNLILTPTLYIALSKSEMLSEDGRCKPFDSRANGYVRGEGVGAVVLKDLAAAARDGDPIHAVVRGAAINHGGRATSLTAPNPTAQAEVIVAAHRSAGIDPATVGYIEAHGTGTALGDPVEIAGLRSALAQRHADLGRSPDDAPLCAIGSVKSNVGHLEAAAGMAGLFKVILALKHGVIPGNLHFREPNPLLEINSSGLQIVAATRNWDRPTDDKGGSLPRRAGLSSFGFGGAGGHLVLEEWCPPPCPDEASTSDNDLVFTLSAQTRPALLDYARRLASFLHARGTANDQSNRSLAAVAATLQVGRDPMTWRLAIVTNDRKDLLGKLDQFLDSDGETIVPGVFFAPQRSHRAAWIGRAKSETRRRFVSALATGRDLAGLAELWVEGEDVDWRLLYPEGMPDRVSLPTYPFERTRHWIDPSHIRSEAAVGSFTYRLSGSEAYLHDHEMGGELVLPGVVCLAIALLASGRSRADGRATRMEQVYWAAPVTFPAGGQGDPCNVMVALKSHVQGVDFESGAPARDDRPARPHAGGTLVFEPHADQSPPERINFEAIRARCGRTFSGAQCYDRFATLGVRYGPSFRVIESLALGDDEAVAILQAPEACTDSGKFAFCPGILDAPLQVAGLMVSGLAERDRAACVPFAVERLDISDAPLTDVRYVTVVRVGNAVFDARLMTADGVVLARLDKIALRPVVRSASSSSSSVRQPKPAEQLLAFTPTWRPAIWRPAAADAVETLIVLDGDGSADALVARLSARTETLHLRLADQPDIAGQIARVATRRAGRIGVLHLASSSAELAHVLDTGFQGALAACRALIASHAGAASYLYVFPETAACAAAHAAMGGFARSVRAEHPALAMRAIAYRPPCDVAELVVRELEAADDAVELKVTTDTRWVRAWEEVPFLPPACQLVWPTAAGAHLITGGTGALGLHLAEWLAERDPGAGIVLAGRQPPSGQAADRITRLTGAGRQVVFMSADLSRREDVRRLIEQVRSKFGRIVGVVHAAGVARDSFILNKTPRQAEAVLGPKVSGLFWLDAETTKDPLNYLAAFSSAAAVFGNVGQADYAFANAFMDHFIAWRERQRQIGLRSGRSVSINWPLWRDGAFKLSADDERAMRRSFGLAPLPTALALDGFERALAAKPAQMLLGIGDRSVVLRALNESVSDLLHRADDPAAGPAVAAQPRLPASAARARLSAVLKALIASDLQMPVDEIDPAAPLDGYGVDSLTALALTRHLENLFGKLSKTLFFEFMTLDALTGYFVEKHADRVAYATRALDPGGVAEPETLPVRADLQRGSAHPPPAKASGAYRPGTEADNEIAIIAVSGRYPQAEDLWQLWRNLESGQDCIEEVPSGRWDYRQYFDPDQTVPGKTYSKWGGFLRDIDKFDPLFFRMSQVEAEHIDPQERIFLETVWHLLEDGGVTRDTLSGLRTGVFVGLMYGHYQLYGVDDALLGIGAATSSSYASVANRVSYFFNFGGPSIAIDTMCSSSLAAIHLACQAIRDGDCDVAVAGGVNIASHPLKYLQLCRGGFLSSDGRCRAFGQGGTGYVPAEGAGAVLLKRRAAAQADGDRILALVKASAVNHGGASKGYSAPNPLAQGGLIKTALTRAGLMPGDIDYIEAHGTGTALGDPIEIAGLLHAFEGHDAPTRPIPIGSIKSNIGHAESAAGIAAVSKVLLQMQHHRLVPSLHAEQLNEHIDIAATPFFVQRELAEWPTPVGASGERRPRNAAISAFGAGGSNAHLILQEYLADPPVSSEGPRPPFLFVLSAKDTTTLKASAARMAAFLRTDGAASDPAALAWTLQTGREAFAQRLALVFHEVDDLSAQLTRYLTDEDASSIDGARIDHGREDQDTATQRLARAWIAGDRVDWSALYDSAPPTRISLPGYQFRRDSCWLPAACWGEAPSPAAVAAASKPTGGAIRQEVTLTADTPIVAGHRVNGQLTFPAVAYIDLVLQSFQTAGHALDTLELRDLTALRPLVVTSEAPVRVAIDGRCASSVGWTVEITDCYRPDDPPFATCMVAVGAPREVVERLAPAGQLTAAPVALDAIYERDRRRGQDYDGEARAVGRVREEAGAFVAELTLPPGAKPDQYLVHPALLLAGTVAADAGRVAEADAPTEPRAYLPMHIEAFRLARPLGARCTARIRKSAIREKGDLVQLSVEFFASDGSLVAELVELSSKRVQPAIPAHDNGQALPRQDFTATVAQDRVRLLFATYLGRNETSLDLDRGFYEMGISSMQVLALTKALEAEVGTALSPTLCFEHTTIRDLAAHLATEFQAIFAVPPQAIGASGLSGTLARLQAATHIPPAPQSAPSEELDHWIARSLLRQLVRAGMLAGQNVPTKHQRWLDESVLLLEAAGFVRRSKGGVELQEPGHRAVRGDDEAAAAATRERFLHDPGWGRQLAVVEKCLERVPEVLRGEVRPTDLLFPRGKPDRVMTLLRDNPLSERLNLVLADIVGQAVQQQLADDPTVRARIVEVGSGTGSTTAAVLPRLDPFAERLEFWFTDVSPGFLSAAEHGIGAGRDYMRYAVWDIAQEEAGPALRDGPYDIAIAANVLHATRNIRAVIGHLAATLRPGGLLVLNEVTRKSAVLLSTFALLDGWWAYEDADIRIPGTPMLSGEQWEAVLRETGFARVWRPLRAPDAFAEVIVAERAGSAPSLRRDVDERLVVKSWQHTGTLERGRSPRNVAILGDEPNKIMAALLAKRLPHSLILDPEDPARGSAGRQFDAIVDLSGCGTTVPHPHPAGWLPWLQQLVAHATDEIVILGVTQGLEAVNAAGSSDAAGARRVGLYRMLQSECARVCSRHVDLDPKSDADACVADILAELADRGDEAEITYRAGQRLRAVLSESPLSTPPSAPAFAADEVLWITGGTRGLGLTVARHAVASWGVRRLLLTGREQLPPRTEWGRHLDGPLAEKLRALEALEQAGVRLMTMSLPCDDSTDARILTATLNEVRRALGPICGVIHAAGLVDRDHLAFISKPAEAIRAVLAPKMAGLDALIRCVAGEPLRFFALFSSVAAAIPALAVGQSDYAMANAYMDYVAMSGKQGLPLVSIQWPSWSGIGMGQTPPGPIYDRTGLSVLTEAAGLQLLDRILANGIGPVVLPVVVADQERWRPDRLMLRRLPADAAPKRERTAPQPPPRRPLAEPTALTAAAEAWIVELLAGMLHYDRERFDRDVAIEDYGVDSIMITQILRTVSQKLRVELDPTLLIEHRTVIAFGGWLAETHGPALRAALGLDVDPPAAVRFPRSAAAYEPASDLPEGRYGGRFDVAVIGLSCRLPGAPTPESYWHLISEGRRAIVRVPPERWGRDTGFHAGLIADHDAFDPSFFLLSDNDAAAMDPQAMLLLEEATFACCDAGYALAELSSRAVGVYVGGRMRHTPLPEALTRARNPVLAVGQNYLATNISQFLNLQGPSLVVDSACSSALVAMHTAIAAMRDGDIEAAFVGGVSLLATDEGHRIFDQRGILARQPEFHAFDRRANGFLPAEGVGVVLLKPLERARADGDRIRAVVRGLAVNNDGRTAGPASPNLAAQKAVMTKALARSNRHPEDVTYIETNASGSELTDLVELKAIRSVYRDGPTVPCSLGSVKPNVGHTLCAEGIAALIKVVLMLENRQIVPFLSGQEPSPHFDIAATPLRFARTLASWPAAPLVAAINCFADGGTNAHAILEAASADDAAAATRQPVSRPALRRRRLSESPVSAVARPLPTAGVEPIAIIGMAGRYPGADGLAAFWEQLQHGSDCVTEVPASRWSPHQVAANAGGRQSVSRWGGFINDVDHFDCAFFHIARLEADIMDPQERLFLQTSWEAIEDAGYTPATLAAPRRITQRNAVGVFVGVMHKDYTLVGAEAARASGKPLALSLNQGQIANRVSFCCDFHGPSMAVDTLCSSSLTAVHLGVESLQRGESDVIIAGGVNLSLHPAKYLTYGMVNLHSSDGRCRAFGTGGDGYVSADGVGAVVLKRLAEAEADGDHIYAVIRSSAANHVGRTSGFSVPSPVGQAAAITAALDRAGIDARSISYVDAHGTGTMLGDPIEVQGLVKAFRRHTGDIGYCALGSVKSNFGHAEAAAGICSLTKVALQLHHRILVPSLHADPENPLLHLEDTPFRVQRRLEHWPEPPPNCGARTPRRAGISAFGATGSNVHVVIEEYQPPEPAKSIETGAPELEIVPLSALDPSRLRDQVDRLRRFLQQVPNGAYPPRLEDIAYTLQVGRRAMPARLALFARSINELQDALARAAAELDADGAKPAGLPLTVVPADLATVEQWLRDRRLDELAAHWRAGGFVAWQHLARRSQPRRVSLPTYAFARQRHWIGEEGVAPDAPAEAAAARLISVPHWVAQAATGSGFGQAPARVLIVADESAALLVKAIAERHQGMRSDATIIRAGLGAQSCHAPHLCWDPLVSDGDALDAWLAKVGPIDCIYFIVAGAIAGGATPRSVSDPGYEIAFLRLVKALHAQERAMADRIACFIITQEAQSPGGAGLPGLGYFLAQDDARFDVRSLDVSPAELETPAGAAALAVAIADEPPSSLGEVFMLRAGRRYARAFRPIASAVPPGVGLRREGCYVIVGGAGVVGRVVTRHLLRHHAARVAWIGRRSASDQAVGAALRAIGEGQCPWYQQADVTNLQQIRAAIAAIRAEFGVIHGVIFAASEMRASDSPRGGMDETAFRSIFTIKAAGSVNLYAAVQNEALDFLCFFSSAEAFAAAATHPAYAAGVNFADWFARSIRSAACFPVGIINWGAWRALLGARADEWSGTGLLDDAEACACFDLAIQLLRSDIADQLLCIRPPNDPKAAAEPRPMPFQRVAGRHAILELLTERLAKSLRVPRTQIVPGTSFADYGVDSIVGMAFAAEVGDLLGVPLNGTILYDYPSLDLLANYLAARRPTPVPANLEGSRDPRFASLAGDLQARFHAGEISAGDVLQLLDRELGTGIRP